MTDGRPETPTNHFTISPVQPAWPSPPAVRRQSQPSQPLRRRVVVTGTSAIIVEALGAALAGRSGLEVVSTLVDEADLFDVVSQHQPEVVVFYLPKLDADTTKVIQELKMHDPAVRVVLLAARPTGQALVLATEAGAAACLSLNARLQDLAEAIRAETTDTMLVDATTLSSLGDAPRVEVPYETNTPLTRRELEVLTMMAEGCSPPVIAAELVISIYTARGHVKRVLRKLGAHSQLEAVAVARKLGLVGTYPSVPAQEEPGRAEPGGPLLP